MGLNRMMMGKGEVKVEDGSKNWSFDETDNKTIAFTVPPGIKRIKVEATIDRNDGEPDASNYANIKNTSTNKVWGAGWSYSGPDSGTGCYAVSLDDDEGVYRCGCHLSDDTGTYRHQCRYLLRLYSCP